MNQSFEQQIKLIRQSGLFDEEWYLKTYPDVEMAGISPIEHYLRYGAFLGRNPSPVFHTVFYALQMLQASGELEEQK